MWFTKNNNSIVLYLKISPGAKKTQLLGLIPIGIPPRLKFSVAAPPRDNLANQELVKFLSLWLHIAKTRIHITKGGTSSHKAVSIVADEPTSSQIINLINQQLRLIDECRDNQLPFL